MTSGGGIIVFGGIGIFYRDFYTDHVQDKGKKIENDYIK